MSMYSDGWSPADALALVGGRNNGDGGLFGGDGIVGLIALIIISGMFGFGGFGMGGGMGGIFPWLLMSGGFNGFGGFGGGAGAAIQGMATRADINEGFALNNLQGGINAIQQGLCDSTYALTNAITNGFNNTNMGMMQGFNGVERGFCNLSSQLADCCCTTQRAIDGINYNMATNTCALQNSMCNNTRDIIESQNSGTRAILDALTAQRIEAKDEKIQSQAVQIQALQLAASQSNQNAVLMAAMDAKTAEILRRTGAECPSAAYIVQPPTPVTFPTNCCGQATFGNNGGCNNGCGNNCGY